MPIEVECPGCGREYRTADDKAGRRFRCSSCNAIISVPDVDADEDFLEVATHSSMTRKTTTLRRVPVDRRSDRPTSAVRSTRRPVADAACPRKPAYHRSSGLRSPERSACY
ncbi:MAG: hypothetical protein R3B90_17170 [Planctomycetaceae bacterium]